MKGLSHLLWLTTASLVFAGGASGQEPTGDFLIGITRASYSSERLQAAPLGGSDIWVSVRSGSRVAPTLGAGVSVPLARFLAVRGEALLVRKGFSSPSVV